MVSASSAHSRSKLSTDYLAISLRLRSRREVERYSLAALADQSGVTKSALRSYELGVAPLPFGVGNRVCEVLRLNQYWLAHGHGSESPWLDFSVFDGGKELLERAESMSFLDAISGVLEPLISDWRATNPAELVSKKKADRDQTAALKRMSDKRLELFLRETVTEFCNAERLHKGEYLKLLRTVLFELEERNSPKNALTESAPSGHCSAMQIADLVKNARTQLGLSREAAAQRWNIPLGTLRKYESGERKPRGLALRQLETILHSSGLSSD